MRCVGGTTSIPTVIAALLTCCCGCVLPVDTISDPCGRAQPVPNFGDPFAELKSAIVANWRGTASVQPQWAWAPSYEVAISFSADGTYTATAPCGIFPFYYDQNPEYGKYEIVDLQSNGDATGRIYLTWDAWSPNDLKAIRLNAEHTYLHFEFYNGNYGPVVYDLFCTP
jgi:hypothetical protein